MTELTYTKNGDYLIPDLTLSETPEDARPLGKYGRLRRSYLQEHRPGLYSRLVLSEKLFLHLGGGIGAPVNFLTIRARLYSRGRQDDPVGCGGFHHGCHTAVGILAAQVAPVGKGCKIHPIKVVFQLHDIFLFFLKNQRQIAQ